MGALSLWCPNPELTLAATLKPKTRSAKRRLSDEERHLWERVTHSANPLHSDTGEGSGATGLPLDAASIPAPAIPEPHRKAPGAPRPRPSKALPKPHPAPAIALPLTGLDRRTEQRLRRGQIEVDGTIDLHGMTQGPAHMALRSFLISAQARGYRLVLVITGKGSPQGTRIEPDLMWGSGRGILRRLVPEWLSQSDFSPWVSGFRNAHQRHGGGGALYVRVRRKRP